MATAHAWYVHREKEREGDQEEKDAIKHRRSENLAPEKNETEKVTACQLGTGYRLK